MELIIIGGTVSLLLVLLVHRRRKVIARKAEHWGGWISQMAYGLMLFGISGTWTALALGRDFPGLDALPLEMQITLGLAIFLMIAGVVAVTDSVRHALRGTEPDRLD